MYCLQHRHHANAVNDGKPLNIRINQKEDDCSKAENRLYCMWMNQWANPQFTDKYSEYLYFKKHVLARIYAREVDCQYRAAFSAVKVLKE